MKHTLRENIMLRKQNEPIINNVSDKCEQKQCKKLYNNILNFVGGMAL